MASDFRFVDPRELAFHPQCPVADPAKLARQIAQFGASTSGMPLAVRL